MESASKHSENEAAEDLDSDQNATSKIIGGVNSDKDEPDDKESSGEEHPDESASAQAEK